MKPSARKLLVVLFACTTASAIYLQAADDTPLPLGANGTPPAAAISPTPVAGKPGKKPKPPPDPNATPKPRKIKEIPFPLPKGNSAERIVIPDMGMAGQLISQLMALKATRTTNELVELQEMKMDLYHPDGKEDFHIIMPASVFNLQTRIITSKEPVTVQTQDFELTGERMEFNTVDRTGQLMGHVHMSIHNLKQVAGPQQSPTPSE